MLAAGLLAGIALSLMVFQYQFRHLEAYVAGHLYGLVTPVLAASQAPIIWFGLGTARAYGLEITPDCSSALLIVPLCGLGILLMIPRRLPVGRVAKALTVSAVVLVTGNLLRIGVIAAAVTWAAWAPAIRLVIWSWGHWSAWSASPSAWRSSRPSSLRGTACG